VPDRVITLRHDPGGARADSTSALRRRFEAIRTELSVPADFPTEVMREARTAVARPRDPIPEATDVPFFTLDPPGAMDLDQAMHLGRDGTGYRVRYAIADLPGFVAPGGALDTEARNRGQTIYLPDGRAPLHPPLLSEDAASLLPRQVRPAYVWDLRLDANGEVRDAHVSRVLVRSQDRLDYPGAQRSIDAGHVDERLALLQEVAGKRSELELERGGASLPMPEQEVTDDGAGNFRLTLRPPLPCEDWNAQISLMTGMAAARVMLDGGVGILRTMPAPDPSAVERFRRQTRALGVAWPTGQRYGEYLRGLDHVDAHHLAVIHQAAGLFRGAGYTPFDGDPPQAIEHAALAAPYAHVTAPLRRLVDRFGLVICEALCAKRPVPEWVRSALATLPKAMADSDRRAGAVERACTDAVEAAALTGLVGSTLVGSVVDLTRKSQPVVQLFEPAVLAMAEGSATPGEQVRVIVGSADIATGRAVLRIEQAG